jgi:tetratricopeptide (TPR) repeat protein
MSAGAQSVVELAHTPNDVRKNLWIAVLLGAGTTLTFMGLAGADFINIDDGKYLTENPHVQRGLTFENVKWAFTTFYFSNWHPLTWVSYMIDVELFGLNPGAMHVVNVGFHVANTLLLFHLLERMTSERWASGMVAALFAVHPLHVESVAWISERKDVLSTCFWILTLYAYVAYVRTRGGRWYAGAVLLFTLGLLCKPMLVTLPFALLLIDLWPLGRLEIGKAAGWVRLRNLAVEKTPFFVLAGISSCVTVLAQREGGAVSSLATLSFERRAQTVITAYARYLEKTFWPIDLSVFYPIPPQWSATQVAGDALLIAGITAVVVWYWRRLPYLLVGWLWFLGTLVPVIGLVQVGGQSMADRYTYIPHIGLFIGLVWTARQLAQRTRLAQFALPVAAAVIIGSLAVMSRQETQYWRDSLSLLTRAMRVSGPQPILLNNLGNALASQGRNDEAIEKFETTLAIDPYDLPALQNLGNLLLQKGKTDEAIARYRTGLGVQPNRADLHCNLGVALAVKGEVQQAVGQFGEALKIDPLYVDAHLNLGHAYRYLGDTNAAISNYLSVTKLKPDDASAHYSLGDTYLSQGRIAEAIKHLSEAVRIDSTLAPGYCQLAAAYGQSGQYENAMTNALKAIELAESQGEAPLAEKARELLKRYRAAPSEKGASR